MKERKLGLLGKKVGMTHIFTDDNEGLGVTVLEVGPCVVLAKRTEEKNDNGKTDGYTALQLGFARKPERLLNKAEQGHFKKAGDDAASRFISEMRVSDETAAKFKVGQQISLKDLEWSIGEKVDVTGTSKGKGFQGVFRRYGMRGMSRTHGTHEFFRHGGSIGNRKFPGKVFKGRKMPGHMGNKRVTTQNLKIVGVRPEDNAILVEGSVPGNKGGYITVRPAIKKNPLP